MNQLDRVMIDADVCLNLVKYDRVNALRCVIENIAQTVYVHEYLLQNELISSTCAHEIRQLIKDNPDCGLSRKDAKCIWLLSCKKRQFDDFKNQFDQKIWPLV